jgi:hypothetical protein
MESDSKRAIIAVILSAIVLFGWQYFFPTAPIIGTNTPVTEVENTVNNTRVSNTGPQNLIENNNESSIAVAPVVSGINVSTVSKYTLAVESASAATAVRYVFKVAIPEVDAIVPISETPPFATAAAGVNTTSTVSVNLVAVKSLS